MAQTKQFAANLGTTVRRQKSTGATAGQGQSQRWYVGRKGNYDYDTYVRFALNWTDVGSIVSAILNIYTGDGGTAEAPSTTTERPTVIIRRLTDSFAEGNAPDGTWETNDYTSAAGVAGEVTPAETRITREALGINQIDITKLVKKWAPSTVAGGGKASNFGIGIFGTSDEKENIGLLSDKWPDTQFRPFITLTYNYGPTVPLAPSSVEPSGSVPALVDFQGDFSDPRSTDELASSTVQVFDAGVAATATAATNLVNSANHGLAVNDIVYFTSLTGGAGLSTFVAYKVRSASAAGFLLKTTADVAIDITTNYSALTWSKLLYNATKPSSRSEKDADRFTHVPDSLLLQPNTTYRWRSRVTDQEGQVGPFTGLVSFSYTNTAPQNPTLTPVSLSSFTNPDSVVFRGTFTDSDPGDELLAYQVQLSAYPEGDARWDDDANILWNTGKRYVSPGAGMETPYGGASLAAGTYYWRARVYDSKHAASGWTYASIVFTDDFEQDPELATTAIQLRPRAPWRIVIKGMGTLRGPGTVVAILEDAKNVGASELYNSPGELHFTLPKNHPQISAVEPRQTHYAVEFRQGDGWHEVFAGLITDFDANDTDVVFYGVDYLGLLDFIVDERYDPSNPDRAAESGGSKYVTTGKNSIRYIVIDQLAKARALANSPVGFITTGTIATMNETLTVYSTYAPVLQFIVGLLDSHRAGTGKRTRLRVRKTNSGGYEFIVQDDPGQIRDNLRMRYGELVQGYRVVAFGADWATRIHGIGRAKDGIKVMYDTDTGQGIPEATWGRFTQVRIFDGVSDPNDFKRRIRQAAMEAGKLGKQVGLGIRTGILQPKDGYDLCDIFPIDIEDNAVSTSSFGSGYWVAVGVTWETKAQTGKQNTTITFQPRQDGVAPDSDLLVMTALSTQAEWQVGWEDPNPLLATSKFWLNQATGIVFKRVDGDMVALGITGTA